MSKPRSLPRHRSDSWAGGFAISEPVYTASISASGGTVVAATERLYRIRPGTTRWQWHDFPDGHGDVSCVAVEPRRPGRPTRFAYAAFPHTLHIGDGEDDVTIDLPLNEGDEIQGLMWAPRATGGDPTMLLHLWLGDRVLRLLPEDGGELHSFEGDFWPSEAKDAEVCAMASDGGRGVVFAELDEENWDIDVWVLEDLAGNMWIRRSIEAPSFPSATRLAVAGTAVAVALASEGGVWIARKPREPFVRIDALGSGNAVLAFGGMGADAPLFAAVQETPDRSAIVRVDAEGRHERIAELSCDDEPAPNPDDVPVPRVSIEEMAWDETRRTLWCAAGRAGILGSTEPGSPVPLGKSGALRAPS